MTYCLSTDMQGIGNCFRRREKAGEGNRSKPMKYSNRKTIVVTATCPGRVDRLRHTPRTAEAQEKMGIKGIRSAARDTRESACLRVASYCQYQIFKHMVGTDDTTSESPYTASTCWVI
jgi:nitrogenase molybdenum-iron protein alpha chain